MKPSFVVELQIIITIALHKIASSYSFSFVKTFLTLPGILPVLISNFLISNASAKNSSKSPSPVPSFMSSPVPTPSLAYPRITAANSSLSYRLTLIDWAFFSTPFSSAF